MTYALQPNGRFLDFRDYHVGQSIEPGGVQKQSYVGGALRRPAPATGFYAHRGRAVQRRPHRLEGSSPTPASPRRRRCCAWAAS